MSDRLGAINYGTDRPNPFGMGPAVRDVAISDETAREIDAEVRRILDEALEQARTIVRQNHALMEKMADALIETETLDGAALADFLQGVRRLDVVRGGAGAS
jgi:cell division protease FtsH